MIFFSKLSKNTKIVSIVFFLGLSIRFMALPFSRTNEIDPAIKIDIAWRWLENPHIITHGIWGPLHTYLIAGAMWLREDPILSPILINIFFSAATAIPLFFFTKNEFGEKASLFVCCAFLLYPVAFRNSLMAYAETPFSFFVALSLLFLSISRRKNGSWNHALIAGLSMTLAAMLRYEGWILIPLLGVILWKKPKLMFVFLISSVVFPIFWTIGNQIHHGDPFYSINVQHSFELERMKLKMTSKEVIKRILFFPGAIWFGMTILLSTLSIWGSIIALREKKSNSIWLLPFLGLLIAFFYKAVSGTLALVPRYSLVLGMFLIPFSTEVLKKIKEEKKRSLASLIVIFSIIPFSYMPYLITAFMPSVMELVPIQNKEPQTLLQAIPRFYKDAEVIDESINQKFPLTNQSVIWVDFSRRVAPTISLRYRIHPENKFFIYSQNELLNPKKLDKLSSFLEKHKIGIILFRKTNKSTTVFEFIDSHNLKINNMHKTLLLKSIIDGDFFVMYRYQVISSKSS